MLDILFRDIDLNMNTFCIMAKIFNKSSVKTVGNKVYTLYTLSLLTNFKTKNYLNTNLY